MLQVHYTAVTATFETSKTHLLCSNIDPADLVPRKRSVSNTSALLLAVAVAVAVAMLSLSAMCAPSRAPLRLATAVCTRLALRLSTAGLRTSPRWPLAPC
jgi:hypothetical protein